MDGAEWMVAKSWRDGDERLLDGEAFFDRRRSDSHRSLKSKDARFRAASEKNKWWDSGDWKGAKRRLLYLLVRSGKSTPESGESTDSSSCDAENGIPTPILV